MGWWSATILGGDAPYDVRANLEDVMNVDCWFEGVNEENQRILVNDNMDQLFEVAKESYDQSIAGQVFGAMILEVGAKMSDEIRQFVLDCANEDEWAHEDEERNGFIQDFISKVIAYPSEGGVRVELAQEGLFEVIEKKIASGEVGLVNKNV